MAENIVLKNGELTLELSAHGAEIQSLKKNSEEYIWCGDPAVWSGHAPVLFPICGALKGDKYTYEGREYSLKRHGFARNSEFTVESNTGDSAVLLLASSDETRAVYPFEFELRITYALKGSAVEIKYSVKNTGDNTMYFSIGSHEAYTCSGGIENYSIFFENEQEINRLLLEDNILSYNTERVTGMGRELPLKNSYFEKDAIVFDEVKSKSAVLKDMRGGREVRVDFADFEYLLVWTKPGADYICIEPWCGLADRTDSDGNIAHKQGIITLEPGTETVRVHTITL